jgi:hypothetical protein
MIKFKKYKSFMVEYRAIIVEHCLAWLELEPRPNSSRVICSQSGENSETLV